MKKILIIDNQGRRDHTGLDGFAFVDFRERLHNPQDLELGDYSTAFVHQANAGEAKWAKEHFQPVFIFSGGISRADILRKSIVNLPREKYRSHIVEFLEIYRDTGALDPSVFFPKGQSGKQTERDG